MRSWPGQARASPCNFVLNYEEGGENNPLHGDATSETFLSELVTAQAFENRHMTMESMYEYGSRAGVWRILREFDASRPAADGVRRDVTALAALPGADRHLPQRAATRSPTTACAGSTTSRCQRPPNASHIAAGHAGC